MRTRKLPSRLESHRLKYNQLGRRGPLLRLEDLTKFEKDLLYQEILQDVRVKQIDFSGELDEQVFDGVEIEVFAEWGVVCHHPFSIRGGIKPTGSVYNCSVCRCAVFPSRVMARKVAVDE
jgi:hypothetical protein